MHEPGQQRKSLRYRHGTHIWYTTSRYFSPISAVWWDRPSPFVVCLAWPSHGWVTDDKRRSSVTQAKPPGETACATNGKSSCMQWWDRLQPVNARLRTRSRLSFARQLARVAGTRGAQRQRSGGARRGAALGRMAQAFGERPAERHGHRDIEAAADHGQAKLFPGGGGNAHAGVAIDALARLVDDFGVGEILRETAPLAGETNHVHVVLGGQGAHQAAIRFAAAGDQTAAGLATGATHRQRLLHFVEARRSEERRVEKECRACTF